MGKGPGSHVLEIPLSACCKATTVTQVGISSQNCSASAEKRGCGSMRNHHCRRSVMPAHNSSGACLIAVLLLLPFDILSLAAQTRASQQKQHDFDVNSSCSCYGLYCPAATCSVLLQ